MFKKEIPYLARIIFAAGYFSSKLRKKSASIFELQSMPDLVKYFRYSIPNFIQTTHPPYQLLKKTHPNHKLVKAPIEWQEIHQAAVDQLLQHLVTPPILAYPYFSKSFILHADASGLRLDGALFQYQNEKLRIIGFRSRTLVGAELKYHSSKLEFLVPQWAVCKHFRDYIFYVLQFWCINRLQSPDIYQEHKQS